MALSPRERSKDSAAARAALIVSEDTPPSIARDLLRSRSFTPVHCRSAESALDRSEAAQPDVAMLFTGEASAALAGTVASLCRALSETALIVVCAEIGRWELRATLAGGAAGIVVDRGDLETTLAPCLDAVLAGHICVPRAHWRQIDPPALSTREKQILGLVVMGYMNSQIGQQLFIAESTVKSHLSSAFGKLGVRSRNEAVRMILDAEGGLGTGILAIVGEPSQQQSEAAVTP